MNEEHKADLENLRKAKETLEDLSSKLNKSGESLRSTYEQMQQNTQVIHQINEQMAKIYRSSIEDLSRADPSYATRLAEQITEDILNGQLARKNLLAITLEVGYGIDAEKAEETVKKIVKDGEPIHVIQNKRTITRVLLGLESHLKSIATDNPQVDLQGIRQAIMVKASDLGKNDGDYFVEDIVSIAYEFYRVKRELQSDHIHDAIVSAATSKLSELVACLYHTNFRKYFLEH